VRISIFGVGYVGAVSCGCLAALGHEIVGVDTSEEKVGLLARGQSPIVEESIGELIADAVRTGQMTATTSAEEAVARTEVSFISVGTPSAADGSVALGAVEGVSRAIGRALRAKSAAHTVVMRSTVPPGTAEACVIPILEQESGRALGDGLAYYSNPEFLREGSAVADFRTPPFTILGGPPGDDAAVPRAIYAAVPAPVHVVPYRVAESVKVLCNAYHAIKLAFANEAGGVLASYGVDAREAFRLFCEDKQLNISPAYLRPGFAFGGSCLPKDMRSFLALARDKAIATPFLGGVLPSNEAIVERALAMITARGRQPVALLGLAFKPGTDDLRESPFVVLAERLIGKGYPLRIYDKHVEVARLMGSNRSYIEREIPHLERLLVGSPAEAVAGARTVVVGHLGREDRPALLAALSDQAVLDLAGIAELQARSGLDYQGFCW
jgi:GDP-mannose 6-dehydrogenase